jgi:integrase
MTEQGLSPKTVKNCHRVMTASFNHAVRLEVRPDNPAAGRRITSPRVEEPQLRTPTPEEVGAIIDGARGGPHFVELLLAADTGMRRSEILGLGWREVDLELGRASVVRTLHADGETLYTDEPKTARSKRTVGLTPRVVAALRKVKADQDRRRLALGPDWQDLGFVFDRSDGRPIHPRPPHQVFRALAERIGLSGIRLHDLRHAFASNLIGVVGTKDTSAPLGHSSEAFTMRTYQHRVPDVNADLVAQAIATVYGQ